MLCPQSCSGSKFSSESSVVFKDTLGVQLLGAGRGVLAFNFFRQCFQNGVNTLNGKPLLFSISSGSARTRFKKFLLLALLAEVDTQSRHLSFGSSVLAPIPIDSFAPVSFASFSRFLMDSPVLKTSVVLVFLNFLLGFLSTDVATSGLQPGTHILFFWRPNKYEFYLLWLLQTKQDCLRSVGQIGTRQ